MYKVKIPIIVAIVIMLVSSTVPLITTGSETQNGSTKPYDFEEDLYISMGRAIQWLKDNQAEDGTWSSDLGVTAMVTYALLNAGLDEDEPVVAQAIEYILDHVQLDGSISAAPTYSTYYTSVCVLALSSTTNTEYEDTVYNAAQFLIESQIKETTIDADPNWAGGFGYGGGKNSGRPDISNTQFALMALHSSEANFDSIRIPQTVWDSAIGFLTRCQNLVETNPLADDTSLPSYNDGGFIYYPGFSKAGECISYGSSTSACVWSMFLCGVDVEDKRVQAGLEWLNLHYTWDVNPNLDAKGLYNYFWCAARVSMIARRTVIIDETGTSHDWYDELARNLIDRLNDDHYWVNNDSDWFWENIPELATAYALLALETQTLSPFNPDLAELGFEVELETGSGELHIYDSRGGHITFDQDTGEHEILPTSNVVVLSSGAGSQSIQLSDLEAGKYYINIVGKDEGSYTLKIASITSTERGTEYEYTGQLSAGTSHGTSVIVTSVEQPLTIYTSAPEPVPVMETNTNTIRIDAGKTITYLLELEEVSGSEEVNDVGLRCVSGQNIQVDFEDNDFDMDASEEKYVMCTIDVPADAENSNDYILIESSNAAPIRVQLEFEQEDDGFALDTYQISILVVFIAIGAMLLIIGYRKGSKSS